MRYRPSSGLEGAPRLVLVGKYSEPSGRNAMMRWWIRDLLGDSLATLLPTRDGSFEGRVRLPQDFLALRLSVVDSTGEEGDVDGLVQVGSHCGRGTMATPSLKAMLAAQETFAETRSDEGAAAHNSSQRCRFAQALFPVASGWMGVRERLRRREGSLQFLSLLPVGGAEVREFLRKAHARPICGRGPAHDMVVFAFRIEEPAQAEMWAKRLVREHPDDPRALYDLARVLHQVELRQPKDLADSIRPWLPCSSLSPCAAAVHRLRRCGDAHRALRRRRDEKTLAQPIRTDCWPRIREWRSLRLWVRAPHAGDSSAGPHGVGDELHSSGGKVPLRWSVLGGRTPVPARTLERHANAGSCRPAERDAETLRHSPTPRSWCANRLSTVCMAGSRRGVSARAWLTLGDTTRAEQELMAGIPPANQDTVFTNDARALLGARFDAVRWNTAREKAHESIGSVSDRRKQSRILRLRSDARGANCNRRHRFAFASCDSARPLSIYRGRPVSLRRTNRHSCSPAADGEGNLLSTMRLYAGATALERVKIPVSAGPFRGRPCFHCRFSRRQCAGRPRRRTGDAHGEARRHPLGSRQDLPRRPVPVAGDLSAEHRSDRGSRTGSILARCCALPGSVARGACARGCARP